MLFFFSQAHRLRALDLLGRFLDLGPWAVNLALSVGIFPYVLKLLQASARELRPLLVSIWAKILSVDTSCQTDLIRDASHKYFLSVLQDDCMMPNHRTWAAFILASIVHNFKWVLTVKWSVLQALQVLTKRFPINTFFPLFFQTRPTRSRARKPHCYLPRTLKRPRSSSATVACHCTWQGLGQLWACSLAWRSG